MLVVTTFRLPQRGAAGAPPRRAAAAAAEAAAARAGLPRRHRIALQRSLRRRGRRAALKCKQPRLRAGVHVDLQRVVVGPGDVQPSRHAHAAAGTVDAARIVGWTALPRATPRLRVRHRRHRSRGRRRPTPEGGESGDMRSIQSSVTIETQ